jgi:hypothetical protein
MSAVVKIFWSRGQYLSKFFVRGKPRPQGYAGFEKAALSVLYMGVVVFFQLKCYS